MRTSNYFYDFDILGNTAGLSNISGLYANEHSYLPFGETLTDTSTVQNPFQMVGQFGVQTDFGGLS